MKNTGRINPITKTPIYQKEEHDINWRECGFSDLSLDEQADILSLIGLTYLSYENKEHVIGMYEYYRDKNLMEL